jgi:vanillate O-demethylase monooxygenase subunit
VFLRNCWYLAAWADELGEGAMLPRKIAGVHVLLLRDAAGAARAIADTCPHRLVPLSRGTCAGGVVTCAYHGLRFAADGKCVDNPHGPITSALTVPSFGCVERHAALWLWLGEHDADPALIPDYGFIDRTAPAARVKGYLHSRADYRLMIDNIMDLTHADYLHAASLGGGINTRAKAEARQDGDEVTIVWTAADDVLAPLHAQALGLDVSRGDLYNQVLWQAPGNMLQRIMLALPGEMDSNPLDSMTCHVMTPESESSTHYFFCHTSDAVSTHPEIAPAILAGLTAAFADEDAPMLEAQTERLAGRDFWALKPALLPSDKGAVLVRRTFDRMLEKELQQ